MASTSTRTDAPSPEAVDDLLADLRAAREERAAAEEAVAEYGEATLDRVVEAHETATGILDAYGDDITGTGDFEQYIEFQGRVGTFVEDLPEDLPVRDAFEAYAEALKRQTLRGRDVRAARDALAPAADLVETRERLADAREACREARRSVVDALDDLENRIEDLERVCSFADVDFSVSVERLRESVAAYDDAVRDAFVDFRRDAPARVVLDFVADAARVPLVPVEAPPADLREYLDAEPAGEEPIPTLVEYAGYSPSKLAHYVDDADAFRRAVTTNRVALERVDADPLTVGWPPPPRGRLRWRAGELVSVVGRLETALDREVSVVERLHAVRERARSPGYEERRRAAVARDRLSEAERTALQSGAAREDLDRAREARDRLRTALD